MDYGELLEIQAARYGEKPFFIGDGAAVSCAALLQKVRAAAACMGKNTARRLVGIRSSSPLAQLTAFLGAEMAGAVPVILHESLRGEKLRRFLVESPVSLVLEARGLEWVPHFPGGDLLPENVCMGVLTSGTSGMPKVLLRTFGSWADFFPAQNRIFAMDDRTRLYLQGSFDFTGNLSMALGVLSAGGTVAGTSSLKPRRWIGDIRKEQVSHLYMIPSKLSALVRTGRTAAGGCMVLAGSS